MHAFRLAALVVAVTTTLAACSDQSAEPLTAPSATRITTEDGFAGIGVFQRYVAIGTSISMGVSSDGVYAASQQTSFPAQLAQLAGRPFSLPLISSPGCASPLIAPLAVGTRLSGEPATIFE